MKAEMKAFDLGMQKSAFFGDMWMGAKGLFGGLNPQQYKQLSGKHWVASLPWNAPHSVTQALAKKK